jgi:N-formylglutamate amidohydrolase
MGADRLSERDLSSRFLEQVATLEEEFRAVAERHVGLIAAAEAELAAAKLRVEFAQDLIKAYRDAGSGVVYGVSLPSMRTYLRVVEGFLAQARSDEQEAVSLSEAKAKQLAMVRSALDEELERLRLARRKLLWDERHRMPNNVDIAAIDQLIDALPALRLEASAGRECQRCAEPVPRGRKRFCSSECRLLYMEENGHLEHAKRSRHYDYGTDDPEDDRW